MFGIKVALDFYFSSRAFVEDALEAAGLVVDAWIERRPYSPEHPATRAYVLARRLT